MTVLAPHEIAALSDTFRLLGEPNRLRLVLACMAGGRSVGELTDELAISQSLASQHLRLLRTARILRAVRDGRHVRYALDDVHVREVLANMVAHFTEPHEHAENLHVASDKETDDG